MMLCCGKEESLGLRRNRENVDVSGSQWPKGKKILSTVRDNSLLKKSWKGAPKSDRAAKGITGTERRLKVQERSKRVKSRAKVSLNQTCQPRKCQDGLSVKNVAHEMWRSVKFGMQQQEDGFSCESQVSHVLLSSP
ncbi:hypothetical protein VTK26DRAFT_8963 [Humicola hyalothermophila]